MRKRHEVVSSIADEIDKNFVLIGATAIEDIIQDGVINMIEYHLLNKIPTERLRVC